MTQPPPARGVTGRVRQHRLGAFVACFLLLGALATTAQAAPPPLTASVVGEQPNAG
ncbi:MAG: hypothetical protein QOJ46_1309, partial [bacterium]